MAQTPAVLVVDSDIQARYEAKQAVKACGLTFAGECGFGMEATTAAREANPDIIAVGVGDATGRPLQTVEALQNLLPDTPVVVYSTAKDIEVVRRAMMAGARDFLARPVKAEDLRKSVIAALDAEEKRKLRQLGHVPGAQTSATVVTVFGAKGGIGKSTIATNLAVGLARLERSSVCLLDLDNGFGDIAGMLDLRPERTIADLIRDIDKVEREDLPKYMMRHAMSDLDVLAGPSVFEWRQISPDDARRAVELLAKHYDTIVLDTSGMLSELTEMAIEIGTIVLWVTTTEYASVRDSIEAMRALKMLSYAEDRVRIVMNAISSDDGVRPQAVQDALQREIFWQIPYDRKVRQGTHLGQPIVVTAPGSIAAKSFADLASVVAGGRVEKNRRTLSPFRWKQGAQQPVPAEGN